MSYKIVRTWEHNKHSLLAVPSTWEDNNILKYPRKNITKYLKIATSKPELDWKQIKCDVKRRELPSYETADYVLQEMINHTDTEDDIKNTATCKQSKPELNLNIIADEIVNLHSKIQQNVTNPNTFQDSTVTYHHDVILNQQNNNATTTVEPVAENLNSGLSYEYILPMCGNETNVNAENLDAFITVQNTLLSNQTKILEQLNSIQNVQNTTIQKIASLSVQLDDTLLQINNYFKNEDMQVALLSACKSNPSNTAFSIKPIETVQQLDELELELSNSANRQQKKQLYSVIYAGGKGIDCAYTLADVLFSRNFLCQCSWSGGSRGNNEAKLAWKSYKNILSFFWEMVYSWDNKYTVADNVDFFKSILKNAKKRNMAKKERASTSRKRTKPSISESRKDDIESDNDETCVNNEKKAKIEKKQSGKYDNNKKSSSKKNNIAGIVEGGIKENEIEDENTLNSMVVENECTIEEIDNKETTNCKDIPEDADSNIDENENTMEEEEDQEREITSNDEETTEDSDETFKNDITQNTIEKEQKNNNDYLKYLSSIIMKQNETIVIEREKKIKENEGDKLKEKNEDKNYDEKNSKVSNSINIDIVNKNVRLEEKFNSILGDSEKKESDKEKVHGTIDYYFTNKENDNIAEKHKKEKKRDRVTHSKSKKYKVNKKKKEQS